MNHPQFPHFRLLSFVMAVLLLGTGQVHARRRVPKLYTYGPTTSELGPVDKAALQKLDPATRAKVEAGKIDTVGFHYTHLGLFWLDIWSWGGQYVVYDDAGTRPPEIVSKAVAAKLMGVEENKLGKPLSYHIPWGLVVIVGLMLLKIVPRMIMRKRQARESAGFSSAPAWTPPPAGYSPPPQSPGAPGPPPVPPPLPPEDR